jgi:hypothetical protein
MTQEGQFLMSSPDQFLMSFDNEDIVAHCCEAWNGLMDQPWRIRSIGHRAWAHAS